MKLKVGLFIFLVTVVSAKVLSQEKNDTIKWATIEQPVIERNRAYKNQISTLKSDSDNYAPLFDHFLLRVKVPELKKGSSEFTKTYGKYFQYVVPASLITYGIITQNNEPLKEIDNNVREEVKEHMKRSIPIDDYLQYTPTVAVYGLDFIGVKAKHNLKERTIVLGTSFLIMGATVQTMKYSINVKRPDDSNSRSFPSGHTATAFVGAQILYHEYKDTSPWISIAGYTVATATGGLRVLNNKHWLSDVAMGAGIGIVSAELGYALLPVFQNLLNRKKEDKHLVVVPTASNGCYGVGMAYTF